MSKENTLQQQVEQLEASLKAEKTISLELSEKVSKLEASLKSEIEKVSDLEQECSELHQSVQVLKTSNDETVSQNEALKVELDQAKSELSDALQTNKLLTNKIEELAGQPAAAATAPETTSTDLAQLQFEKDGVKYGFNFAKITHKKMAISAAEIAVDETLQDELIALKSGILKVL